MLSLQKFRRWNRTFEYQPFDLVPPAEYSLRGTRCSAGRCVKAPERHGRALNKVAELNCIIIRNLLDANFLTARTVWRLRRIVYRPPPLRCKPNGFNGRYTYKERAIDILLFVEFAVYIANMYRMQLLPRTCGLPSVVNWRIEKRGKRHLNPQQPKVFGVKFSWRDFEGFFQSKYEFVSFENV